MHPGYGFLSENADFAEACADAGLVFVGPPAAAIRAMGSKSGAKALMEKAGVPLVPGYHGEAQDAATLARRPTQIGFPVLVKASRRRRRQAACASSTRRRTARGARSAKREAKAAFGDDRC